MATPTQDVIWDAERLANPHAQVDKAQRVQAMFDAIAPTYERVNRILSAGQDAHWRRRAVKLACVTPTDRVLDLACGTGDFARAFQKAEPALVVGSDFSQNMLRLAAQRSGSDLRWCRGDAMALPFEDGAFTIVSCAFGVRNFQELLPGLREMYRVLSPGGRVIILEFSLPKSRFLGGIYLFYLRRILPLLARLISRDRTGAYSYLPSSMAAYADIHGMVQFLSSAGFVEIEHLSLTFGTVAVYLGRKK